MKRKEIELMLASKLKTIENRSSAICDSFDKELIHDFRLSVKSLRSLLHLLGSNADNNIKFRIPEKLKRLYDLAGIIRESELEKEFLNRMQVNVPNYAAFLDNTVKQKKKEWKKYYSRKVIRKASKKFLALKYKAPDSKSLSDFSNVCMMSLTTLKGSPTDSQLHKVRKNVKDILQLAKLIEKKTWTSAVLLNDFIIRELQEIAQNIGDYNDERVIINHLNAFPLHVLSDNEKATIKKFRNVERKKLRFEKKLLVKTSRSAIVKIAKLVR